MAWITWFPSDSSQETRLSGVLSPRVLAFPSLVAVSPLETFFGWVSVSEVPFDLPFTRSPQVVCPPVVGVVFPGRRCGFVLSLSLSRARRGVVTYGR